MRLTKIKRAFSFFQTVIVLGMLGAFLFVVVYGYISKVKEEIYADLDKGTRLIVEYVRRGEEVPEAAKDLYFFFIINAEDGSYIVERKDAEEPGGKLWEGFRTKLTYQMQIQKNGRISYPIKSPKEIFKSSRVLQYSTVEALGWVVISEAYLPSEWDLGQRAISRGDLFNLLLCTIFGFTILKLITYSYFMRIEAQESDAHEYNFGGFNQNISKVVFQDSVSEINVQTDPIEAEEKPINKSQEAPLKTTYSNNTIQTHLDYASEDDIRQTLQPVHPLEKKLNGYHPQAEMDKAKVESVGHKAEEVYERKKNEGQEYPTLKIQEVKSKALKKLLTELRDHKRRS